MSAIRVDSLTKRYGDVTALNGLTMTVEAGEFYGLLGPNGAGKTTTIEILTGQTAPDQGSASVLGIDPIADPVDLRQAVGILPEKEAPPSLMTPREYLRFTGAVRELPADRIDDGIATWAERLAFAENLDVLATDLSRGHQQKVMIAAAFLHEPAVVFIDEPLANLDPIVQEQVKSFLATYRADGNTVLLSTHNVDVGADLCTRVAILQTGELIEEIRPDEIGPDRTLLDEFIQQTNGPDLPSHA